MLSFRQADITILHEKPQLTTCTMSSILFQVALNYYIIYSRLWCFFLTFYLLTFSYVGGSRGLSDTYFQDGASAGGSVGRFGECYSTHSARQTYKCTADPHGRPACLCVHCRQLCHPTDENPNPLCILTAGLFPLHCPLEELGQFLRTHLPYSADS